ncbi:alpha/beta fold hydrolase [Nocardia sp. NPDC059246]
MRFDWSAHIRDSQALGRRLRYVDVGTGSPILLLHGLGGSWQTWLQNIPALSSGYRVIAVDLPGFGKSEPLAGPVSVDDFVGALVALLDELGIGEPVVIGHSMGGLVSMRLAVTHPQRVRRLILLSAAGVELSAVRLAVINRGFAILNAFLVLPRLARSVARHPALHRPLLRRLVFDPNALPPKLAAEVIPAMRAPGFGTALRATVHAIPRMDPAGIRCPTLVVWGDRDNILPLHAAEQFVANLDDAQLEIIENAGHCAMFEHPDVFNALVLHHLAEVGIPPVARGRQVS